MDAERLCEGCGEPFEATRPNRRYHGPRCRKLAFLRRQHEREVGDQGTPTYLDPGMVAPSGHMLDREAVIEEALSEPRLLVYIARAAQTNWRAAAWLLERRHPERWALGAEPERPLLPDPFTEVDELAQRRRQRYD